MQENSHYFYHHHHHHHHIIKVLQLVFLSSPIKRTEHQNLWWNIKNNMYKGLKGFIIEKIVLLEFSRSLKDVLIVYI